MSKKKLDDKNEIIKMMNYIKLLKQSAQRSPFTGILTLFCYTLWKNYRYSQTKLAKFCEAFKRIENEYDEKDISPLSDKLYSYVGWTVEYEVFTEADVRWYSSKVMKQAALEQMKCNNEINEKSTRNLLIGFNALAFDENFGIKKLTNFKDILQSRLAEVGKDKSEREYGVMDLWQELVDGPGILIEKPLIEH